MKMIMAVLLAMTVGSLANAAGETCVMRSRIDSFHVIDRDTIRLSARRDSFIAKVAGCNLWFADRIAFDDRYGGMRVCRGDDMYVVDFYGHITDRCWITSLQAE